MLCNESNEANVVQIIKELVGHLEGLEVPWYNKESVSH